MDYYKNLTKEDVDKVLNLSESFITYDIYYNNVSKDLYFFGIKKGESIPKLTLPIYPYAIRLL